MTVNLRPSSTLPGTRSGPRRVSLAAGLVGLSVLIAPALMGLIIHRYGVNAPFWDEWGELSIVFKACDGTLDISSFFAQQNEHRPVTSRIASVVLAKTTQLNLVDEMYLGFAFEFLALVLIWRMLATGQKNKASALVAPLTVVASLLLFWTVAFENWTWGIASFQYLSSVFWAVLALWGLTNWPGRWTGLVIGCVSMTVAIFTTALGFALVPVGLLAIASYGLLGRKVQWAQICVFGVVAAVCTAVYLRHYASPGFYAPPSLARIRPVEMIRYFLTYLGSPFWTTKGGLAPALGFFGLCGLFAGAYYILRFMPESIEGGLPWFLLACYSLVNGGVITFARLDFGVEQALAPRYRSIVVLFWVSLIVLLSMIMVHISSRLSRPVMMMALTIGVILFAGGYCYLYYRGLRHIQLRSQLFAEGLPYLMQYETAPDEKLRTFHPDPNAVRELSRKLERCHLGPFAH